MTGLVKLVLFICVINELNCACVCYNSDTQIKEEVRKSREDWSVTSGHSNQPNGKVDQENSQRIPVIRYGELIVLGCVL